MTIQVIDIGYPPSSDGELVGFKLFSPQSDDRYDIHNIRLDGWVLAKRGSVQRLQLMHGTQAWKSIPVSLACEPASAAHPDASGRATCGFKGSVGTIGLPPQFSIQIFAVLRNGHRIHCATIRAQRGAIESPFNARFNPLVLTSLARTGTTRLMQTLSLHPAILLDGKYPFEARPGCYWLHMLKVLTEPSLGKNTFEADLSVLPPCPMNSEASASQPLLRAWFGNDYVSRTAAFAQQNIDALYSQLAVIHGKEESAQYFAEKSLPCHLQWIASEIYPKSKEVVLIRDFRDMICSMISFNLKRGFATFGRENVESDAEFIHQKQHDIRQLLRVIRQRREQILVVRYEDLVTNSSCTLKRIFEYLGVANDNGTIDSIASEHKRVSPNLDFHRTTADEAASVGRWKRDLAPKLQALCAEVLGDLLAEAGYD